MKIIMVVDDEPDQRYTLKYMVESKTEKYKIIEASSGKECLEKLSNVKPDLILLDIMMPEMTGWELFEIIKSNKNWKDIPIVFLTARDDEVAKKAGVFLGDDFILKPYDIDNLINKIDAII